MRLIVGGATVEGGTNVEGGNSSHGWRAELMLQELMCRLVHFRAKVGNRAHVQGGAWLTHREHMWMVLTQGKANSVPQSGGLPFPGSSEMCSLPDTFMLSPGETCTPFFSWAAEESQGSLGPPTM